jgi:hypothetical protein
MLLITPSIGPTHKVLSLLYYVLSVEFVKDVPFLQAFLKTKEKGGEDGEV